MARELRLAFGRCSCRERQADPTSQAVCDALMQRLNTLQAKPEESLAEIPEYSEEVVSVLGRFVIFQTYRIPHYEGESMVIVRAFFRTWRRPTWISFQRIGRHFSEAFLVKRDGTRVTAPDDDMWEFR